MLLSFYSTPDYYFYILIIIIDFASLSIRRYNIREERREKEEEELRFFCDSRYTDDTIPLHDTDACIIISITINSICKISITSEHRIWRLV